MVLQMDRMTYDEVGEYLRVGPGIAIVPIGATEQHGVHAAIGTDTFAVCMVAEKVAERVNAILLPALPYAISTHHIGFPGYVTLRPSTLVQVAREICQSLMDQGFKLIFLLSGHRGNEDALRVAAMESRKPGGPHVLTMSYQDGNKGHLRETVGDWPRELTPADERYGADGHGGAVEGSLAMAYCPEGYRPHKMVRPDRAMVDARRGFPFTAMQYIEEYAPAGHFGDPTGTSIELGHRIAEKTAERIANELQRFINTFMQAERMANGE